MKKTKYSVSKMNELAYEFLKETLNMEFDIHLYPVVGTLCFRREESANAEIMEITKGSLRGINYLKRLREDFKEWMYERDANCDWWG